MQACLADGAFTELGVGELFGQVIFEKPTCITLVDLPVSNQIPAEEFKKESNP